MLKAIGTQKLSVIIIIEMFVIEGCPLSEIPLQLHSKYGKKTLSIKEHFDNKMAGPIHAMIIQRSQLKCNKMVYFSLYLLFSMTNSLFVKNAKSLSL